MGIDLKTLKAVFLLLLVVQSSANSQWFWSDNYYEISGKGLGLIYAKGKPTIEGPFTVFTKWPENLEWRVKTEDVRSIKDIGPLSPEEIKDQKLKSIFTEFEMDGGFFSVEQLKFARGNRYSDDEIWDFWVAKNPKLQEAKDKGLSLDIMAEAFERQGKYK